MKRRYARIAATASYVPEKVLTNKELESKVDTTDEWIQLRTGIKERRVASETESASTMGVAAVGNLLKQHDFNPEDIDLIIVPTSTPDMVFPATACIIQEQIGAVNAGVFDLAAACSGFVYAVDTAATFIETGEYNTILVVATEKNSAILNWEDRNTSILFGDGASATLLTASDDESGVLGWNAHTDPTEPENLYIPAGGSRHPMTAEMAEKRMNTIKMNGREVYKKAVTRFRESIEALLEKTGVSINDISLIVPHQANIRIIQTLAKDFDLPLDRFMINLDRYGNTSASSIGIALDEAIQANRIKRGDYVILTAFGAGFSFGSTLIRW